jgi:hypothetical protein
MSMFMKNSSRKSSNNKKSKLLTLESVITIEISSYYFKIEVLKLQLLLRISKLLKLITRLDNASKTIRNHLISQSVPSFLSQIKKQRKEP